MWNIVTHINIREKSHRYSARCCPPPIIHRVDPGGQYGLADLCEMTLSECSCQDVTPTRGNKITANITTDDSRPGFLHSDRHLVSSPMPDVLPRVHRQLADVPQCGQSSGLQRLCVRAKRRAHKGYAKRKEWEPVGEKYVLRVAAATSLSTYPTRGMCKSFLIRTVRRSSKAANLNPAYTAT